jgi:hypothetical protein
MDTEEFINFWLVKVGKSIISEWRGSGGRKGSKFLRSSPNEQDYGLTMDLAYA